MSSTPPESMDHPWASQFLPEAQIEGRYFSGPVHEDKDWTEEDTIEMEGIVGKINSFGWRREMGCELISDPGRLIVPEFLEVESDTVKAWERPRDFIPILGADGGFVDFFACLFGYVDFDRQKLIVENELLLRRKNTAEVAREVKDIERATFGHETANGEFFWPNGRPRRFADMTPREIADLNEIYHVLFLAADKHDQPAQVATLRSKVGKGQIIIHPRCKNLIYQLKTGIMDTRGKFERTEGQGHYDAIAALVYMNRMAPWRKNPSGEVPAVDRAKVEVGRNQRNETFTGSSLHTRGFTRSNIRLRGRF